MLSFRYWEFYQLVIPELPGSGSEMIFLGSGKMFGSIRISIQNTEVLYIPFFLTIKIMFEHF